MEKKGSILNQLAIISDLLENVNMETLFTSVEFVLDEKEYDKLFNIIAKKSTTKSTNIDKVFSVKIGTIDFMFNKSSA